MTSPVPPEWIESIVGVLAWFMLLGRGGFAILDETYRFVREERGAPLAVMPKEVKKELRFEPSAAKPPPMPSPPPRRAVSADAPIPDSKKAKPEERPTAKKSKPQGKTEPARDTKIDIKNEPTTKVKSEEPLPVKQNAASSKDEVGSPGDGSRTQNEGEKARPVDDDESGEFPTTRTQASTSRASSRSTASTLLAT